MPNDIFDDIRSRLDCRDVAKGLGLRAGSGYFQCPDPNCPTAKGKRMTAKCGDGVTFTCQACGCMGDAIDLIQVARGVGKREALREAKGLAGIIEGEDLPPIPDREPTPVVTIPADELQARYHVLTIATEHYDSLRREGAEYLESLGPRYSDGDKDTAIRYLTVARAYLNSRGIPPLMRYPVPIGLVPWWNTGLSVRLESEGDDLVAVGQRVGILKRKANRVFETYRGRVWLPWQDDDGLLTVNVKGRGIPDLADPCKLTLKKLREGEDRRRLKLPMLFLRTGTSSIVKPPHVIKTTHPFGWDAAHGLMAQRVRDDDTRILICEGELDAMSALRSGVPAMATGGTSGISGARLSEICEHPEDYCIFFDGDEEDYGLKAARKLAKATGIRWTVPPSGDLNDILMDHGAGGLRLHVAELVGTSAAPGSMYVEHPTPPEDATGRPEDTMDFGMPDGWGMDKSMLCSIQISAKGEEMWQPTGIRNPPVVAWRGRDVLDHTVVVSIRGNVVGTGDPVEVSLPRARIKTAREIVPALADHGIDVDSNTAKHLVAFLTDYEHFFGGRLPFKYGSRQMGWHGGSFLYGRDCYGGEKISYIGEEVKVLDSLGTRGNLKGWQEGVLKKLEKYPAALFGLYAAMCAPVVAMVPDLTGFLLEFSGGSSSGKSTASAGIASAFGDPGKNGGLMRPFNDTIVALELYAAVMNNLPLFLEDTHLIAPEERARDIVMMWANGQGKGRSKVGGSARQEPRQWSTVSILTGEAPITRSTTYGGVGARLLSMPPPLPRPEQQTNGDVVADITVMERERVRHYGHAGREWVQWLVNGGLSRVLDTFEYWMPIVQRTARTDGPQQRWAKDIALVIAVAQECAPVIGGKSAETACLELGVAFLKDTTSPDQATTAIEMVLAWVAMDYAGGVEGDHEKVQGFQRKIWFRIMDDGTVCVVAAEVKARLKAEGIDMAQQRKVWMERGWLAYQGKAVSRCSVRIASGTTSCIPITRAAANRESRDTDAQPNMHDAMATVH